MATAISSLRITRPSRRAVGVWLFAVALLIAAMVTVGGLTRLTGSGLSITEWHPVTGAVPPLSDQAWQSEFAKYQRIPQYQLQNRGMSLGDFKAIYWWEWSHRFLGRLLGFVFLVLFLFFAFAGAISRADLPRMVLLFALGGLQGFVGWWMVESGLETRVSVSQYRLAIHLGVAIVLLGAILWTAFEYLRSRSFSPARGGRGMRIATFLLAGLIYLQMLLGALVAGLHAGLIYNTWPSMDGRVFPETPFFSRPWWINFFENPGLAQFDHRVGAYLIAMAVVALWIVGRRAKLEGPARISSDALLAITALQFLLGIATLVSQAPVALAALHQATAVALFASAVWHAYEISPNKSVQAVASA
ncbi:MAG: COX15/CtaA family protein [Rhizomicrobium sp.]|jgi:cytochrome c oxidase assembly protein subunit 15